MYSRSVPVAACTKEDTGQVGIIRSDWFRVLAFVIIVRLLLNIPALVASNAGGLLAAEGVPVLPISPSTFPGVWLRWDSSYYFGIADQGYTADEDYTNFWPGYPLLVRALSLGIPEAVPWAGVLVSLLAFAVANVVLWQQVKLDLTARTAWGTVVLLNLFPTSFFFSAVYAESLFLLFSVLVYWFAAHGRDWLAALFVALASITRIYGILLLAVLLVEVLSAPQRRTPRRILLLGLASCSLLLAWGAALVFMVQSPLASFISQTGLMRRSITVPGLSLLHSLAVAVAGWGGFKTNWFLRVCSAYDSLAALLFIAAGVIGFLVLPRRSLYVYNAVAVLALMMAHGPYALGLYSISRYVLALFPSFIVFAVLLERAPRLRVVVWASMGCALCAMTVWFATGRWVA